MLTVAILPAPMSGCAAYRLFFPLMELQRRGEIRLVCSIAYRAPDGRPRLQPVGNLPFDVIENASAHGQFALSEEEIETADVVILQKTGGLKTGVENEIGLLETVERLGRKFVYEVDDDLENVTRLNPCYIEELQHNPGFVQRMRAVAHRCRLVTCTTPYLADRMRRINPDVRVVPNGVDLSTWRPEGYVGPIEKKAGDPLRVAWICSRNHVEDADLLVKPWRTIASKYPNVTFVLAGAFFWKLKQALGDRLEFHSGVPMSSYPEFCRSLVVDIAVAPLVDSKFARSKSNLRWVEMTALGVPMVLSDVEPYRSTAKSRAKLCRSQGDWVRSLSELIESPSLRASIAESALKEVASCWTMERSSEQWLAVLREVSSL